MKGFSKVTFGSDDDEGGSGTAVGCPKCGALACFCIRDLSSQAEMEIGGKSRQMGKESKEVAQRKEEVKRNV
jgi:hypothetical protein